VQTLTNEIIVYQSDATINANINQTFMNIHFIKAMQEQKEKSIANLGNIPPQSTTTLA
jgi:hypothetical protein